MKYDFGDGVIFRETGPSGDSLGRAASVVAITPVETEAQVDFFGYPLGTILYTIEFCNGSDKLVPEDALERDPTI